MKLWFSFKVSVNKVFVRNRVILKLTVSFLTAKLVFHEFENHQALTHLIMIDHQAFPYLLTIWGAQITIHYSKIHGILFKYTVTLRITLMSMTSAHRTKGHRTKLLSHLGNKYCFCHHVTKVNYNLYPKAIPTQSWLKCARFV